MPSIICIVSHPFLALSSRDERDPRFEHVWNLPAFGVQNPDGTANQDAITVLAEGLARRLDGVDAFLNPDHFFREVAFLSGGIPRDAIRILHAAVLAAAKAGKVNALHLSRGVQEVRQDLSQSLREEDWAILRKVMETGRHHGASSLIAHNAIVAYEGPEERYWRPHPLLLPLLQERPFELISAQRGRA